MKARKFDYETKTFNEWNIDNDCVSVPKYTDLEIPCANCRKLIQAGDGCASKFIVNESSDDLAYIICSECHKQEMLQLEKH